MPDPTTNPAPSAASGTPPASTNPNDGQNTPPASGTPPANNVQNGGQSTPPANDPPPANTETPPANTTPAEQTPPANEPPPAPDILDLAKKGEKGEPEAKKQENAADIADYLRQAGFENGAEDIVVGTSQPDEPEAKIPAHEVSAICTTLRDIGIPPDKARPMIGLVAALDRLRATKQAEVDRQTLATIRQATAKEFGDNLGAAARDMVSGGERLFGAELWADICTIPALINDKRFVRAMSAYGRSGRNDNGGPAPASSGGSGKVRFDLASFSEGTGRY